MLEKYKIALAKLRIDRVPERWDEATNGGAPHKALLLLSVMDLIAQGEINSALVVLKADLIDVFDRYWREVGWRPGQPAAGAAGRALYAATPGA
jgi:putative restriction endonuclease